MEHKFLDEITEDTVNELKNRNCTHAVVGIFQWPFSDQTKYSNITISDFVRDMTNVTQLLETGARDPHNPLQRVILRSVHTNGLKATVLRCDDFRHPINAALATKSLQRIAQGFSPLVSFVDTSFILDPVWDEPDDFSHYKGLAGVHEAAFILSEILTKEWEEYSASW